MNNDMEITSIVGTSRKEMKSMYLKIAKQEFSDKALRRMRAIIDDSEKYQEFVKIALSHCNTMSSVSNNPTAYRSAAKIDRDLKIALEAIKTLSHKRDCMDHMIGAYGDLFPHAEGSIYLEHWGQVDSQSNETAYYRPGNTTPTFGDGSFPPPIEIKISEMLDRVKKSLEHALEQKDLTPVNKGGQRSIPDLDRAFIWVLAYHYERIVEDKIQFEEGEIFVHILDIITMDIAGMQYSASDIKAAFKDRPLPPVK